ncbi:nitrate/nitrite transporter [Sulfurovum sp. bin170]|uniref:MFS transporter n=1 Tax=Sulfurovum sp. bin170 TaxID=2695268 RepID=UPI001CB7468D|nr:MFS transporter [Sulfurovum sp. bin170]
MSMMKEATPKSYRMLVMNTLAFTIAFAAWLSNGVLITFLISNGILDWTAVEMGTVIGIPVLTGALFRLPMGILTDKFGGRPIFTINLLVASLGMVLMSQAVTYTDFVIASLLFGTVGATFAVGIAFTSVWFPKEKQGLALGIFGAGNAGAALTALFAPTILMGLIAGGDMEAWRELPIMYAIMLSVMAVIFFFATENRKPDSSDRTLAQMLAPLKDIRVWRLGMYYFIVFGLFVAFSQWLVPYFVNVYALPLVTAGLFAAAFSFPSGVIRAFGGYLSDKFGGNTVTMWVFITAIIISAMLMVPKMTIESPGKGVMSKLPGEVTAVTENTVVVTNPKAGERTYKFIPQIGEFDKDTNDFFMFPTKKVTQVAVVQVGDKIGKKQLLIQGTTEIFFQANVWIFGILAVLVGAIWGIGKASVYKLVAEYYPQEVGVVGGIVGVLGGLGGFISPIIFGWLLGLTGLWSSAWMFVLAVTLFAFVLLTKAMNQPGAAK